MPPIQASYDHNELAWSAAPYRPRSRQRTTSLRGDSVRERPSSSSSMNSFTDDGLISLSSTPMGSLSHVQHRAQCTSDNTSAFDFPKPRGDPPLYCKARMTDVSYVSHFSAYFFPLLSNINLVYALFACLICFIGISTIFTRRTDSTDYASLTSPLRHTSTTSSSDGSASSLASSFLSGSSAPTSVGHNDLLHESPEALHPKYHHGAFATTDHSYSHSGAINGGRLGSNGGSRPMLRQQSSYADLLGNQLPPPALADVFAPLQLDSATAQELDEEPPLTLPQPWAMERQRTNSTYDLLRRPSFSTGLTRGGSMLSTSGGADRLSSSVDLGRSRSRSPVPRPSLSTSTSSSIHLQSVIPPDMPKSKFVEGLVGAACIAVEVVWKVPDSQGGFITPHLSPERSPASVLPLRHFIKEVLRRSRSTCSTLQTALYYIHKSREAIRERVRAAEDAKIELMRIRASGQVDAASWNGFTLPSPPYGEHDQVMAGNSQQYSAKNIASLLKKVRDPVLCGRRMFLAALICASKFLQDRTYSNRAWAKISSLPVPEINSNEKAFLEVLDYNLYVNADLFRNWTRRLQDLADKQDRKQSLSVSPIGAVSIQQRALLGSQFAAAHREGLERSASEYLPAPEPAMHMKAKPPLSSSHSASHILPRPQLAQSGRFLTTASSFPILQNDPLKKFASSLGGSCSDFARSMGDDWSAVGDNMVL